MQEERELHVLLLAADHKLEVLYVEKCWSVVVLLEPLRGLQTVSPF